MTPLVEVDVEVERALARLAPEGRLLVAVSGGADSVAALLLVRALGREAFAAHFDHQLRASSAGDAAFVRALCERLGVELLAGGADVGQVAAARRWNVEDAARRLRYEFLHRAAKRSRSAAIVVAHTRDDQAETFLLQALRGSAFPAGMAERRALVVRPLLGVGRAELRDYLVARQQPWREDESNRDVTLARAWLRQEVMPVLARRFPHAAESLARTGGVLRDADTAIDDLAKRLLGGPPLKVRALAAAPVAAQRSALARLVEDAGVTPTFALVESARAVALRARDVPTAGPWRVSLGAERFLRVAYGRVDVARRNAGVLTEPRRLGSVAEFERELASPPDAAHDDWQVRLPTAAEVGALLEARPGGLTLRHRLPGDRVRLPGGGKRLAELLIDRKVPAEERDGLLLLAAGDEVVWVEGLALGGTAADLRFMRHALELARAAGAAGELPVGAVVVRAGEVMAAAGNRTEANSDPSAHAELLALRAAARASSDWRLERATLYVTLEPCPMCFGAVLQTRLDRVVYGADNVLEGALGSVMDLRYGGWKRKPQVEGGIMAAESTRLLREFFARRR